MARAKEKNEVIIHSVPIDITPFLEEQKREQVPNPNYVPFPEPWPEMSRLRMWWKYNTTKDNDGFYPFENMRNYAILGIGYLILIPLAIYGVILVLT